MPPYGLIEIYYGKPWSFEQRIAYAPFLKEIGYSFYFYGPKIDDSFRKNWQRPFSKEEITRLIDLKKAFFEHGIKFGVVFSPHGLNNGFETTHKVAFKEKMSQLEVLELDFFGLFFDDMPSSANLADRQIEIVNFARQITKSKIVFCPSFYSDDPLLDMLFGDRPTEYLKTIGESLDQTIEILWTGPQIISPEIHDDHLIEVSRTLRRKPFVCDNLYANDGPINCPFLRLMGPVGRSLGALQHSSYWGLNVMNQPELSKIALKAFALAFQKSLSPRQAFEMAVRGQVDAATADFILMHAEDFTSKGLEHYPEGEREKMRSFLLKDENPARRDIVDWLTGLYATDFMTMIEQACYVGDVAS